MDRENPKNRVSQEGKTVSTKGSVRRSRKSLSAGGGRARNGKKSGDGSGSEVSENSAVGTRGAQIKKPEKVDSRDKETVVKAGASDEDERYCFFCGTFPDGSQLVDGTHAPICSSCVFSLSARLAEEDREAGKKAPRARSLEQMYEEDGDLPAHEYQNRMDLAGAYRELGKKNLALKELFFALEASLICRDWGFALKVVAEIRSISDGPTIRDRIHEALSLHRPVE